MPTPIYGVDKEGDSQPVFVNKRGRLRIVDTGWLVVLVALEALQLAAMVALWVLAQ